MQVANNSRGSSRPRPDAVSLSKEGKWENSSLSDRTIQDQVIHYLADANVRRTGNKLDFLKAEEAERARRFSRFLARRYYRDRLHRGFRYSRALARDARQAEDGVDTPEFEAILNHCALGSFTTSMEIGRLAIERLLPLRQEVWWNDVLQYDLAFFLQLATSEATPPSDFPRKSLSAMVRNFQFQVPELVSGKSASDDLQCKSTLLFSRTHHGRVCVVQLDAISEAVFLAVNGTSTPDQIASKCAASISEIRRILATLADIGAVV